MYILITLATLIVIALSYYAGTLLWQVKAQKEAKAAEKTKRVTYLTDSIFHIAKAMQAEQCESSEGVLRIWVLLKHYNNEQDTPKLYEEIYPGYAALYNEIKDMPTHDARKKLSKKELLKLDLQRFKAEETYEQQITLDTNELLTEFNTNS